MRFPGFITRNFRLKALSAVLALITWTVVVYANNPPDSRSFTVGIPGQPSGSFVMVNPIMPLSLRITGTRDHIQAFDPSTNLTVKADFTAITKAGLQNIPLTVQNNDRDVQLDTPPTTVQVDVDELSTKQVDISANIKVGPPPGFLPGTPQLNQPSVVVSGGKRVLQQALHAKVDIDLHDNRTNFDAVLPVVLLDAAGNTITNLGVTPPSVHVTVEVSPSLTSRAVPVIVTTVGTPATGHILTGLAVDPQTVVLQGPQDVLNTINSITMIISINGLTANELLNQRVSSGRAGVTSTPDTVVIRVTVANQALPTPTPTAAASPSSPPTPGGPTPTPTPTATLPPPSPTP
jgi:YbbR domain-containing protein